MRRVASCQPERAVFHVGHNVGSEPRWTHTQIELAWRKVRSQLELTPDASFVAQRGVWTDPEGHAVSEVSTRIEVLKTWETPSFDFTNTCLNTAEELARELKQEAVVVDMGPGGAVWTVSP